jgi:hypothetical protein
LLHRERLFPGYTVFTWHVSQNAGLRNYLEMQAAVKMAVVFYPL